MTVRSAASRASVSAHHKALRKRYSVLVEAGLTVCTRCKRPIVPGTAWDLDHRDDRSGYRGPSHQRCNRRAGAEKLNALKRAVAGARRHSRRW